VENAIERYEAMLKEQRGYPDPDPAMVESLEQMISNRHEVKDILRQAGRDLVAIQAEEDRAK
jgi:hypothetical protein